VVADTATISWERPSAVHPDNALQLYRLFRAPLGEAFGAEPIAEVADSSSVAAYVDAGLTFADYHYALTALYEIAESDTSEHVEVTRQDTWSSPPKNLVLASVEEDTIRIAWERPEPIHPVNHLQYYRIFRAPLGEEYGIEPIAELADSAAIATYTDSAVDYASYHYMITAQYDSLESDPSNDLEIPEQIWWPSPVNLVAWAQSDTIVLQWERPEPVHPDNQLLSYRIYRALAGEPFPPQPTYSVVDSSDLVEYLDVEVGYETYHYIVTALYAYGESEPSGEVEVTVYLPEGVEDLSKPRRLSLQIMPNPFNPTTMIRYTSIGATPLRLTIYAVAGRRVRTLVDGSTSTAGEHLIEWDGTDQQGRAVASGIYLLRLEQEQQFLTRRLILLK
jgi:hypothetical protein